MFSEEDFMIVEPIVLAVYLNKNNYKDRLLISELRKKAQMIRLEGDDSSFYVKADEVEDILHTKYLKEIQNLDSTSPSKLANTYNSVYFIENALRYFDSLKYFNINVSEVEEPKSSKDTVFDYKVIHSKIDLASNLEEDYFEYCLDIFRRIGIYSPSYVDPTPYLEVSIRELYNLLYKYASQFDEESQEFHDVISIVDLMGKKIEADNSTALIILKK
jgi:hypothetical protein